MTSSFVPHLKPLGEFKLELLSGKAQFGSKSAIYCPMWPWNLTDDLEQGKSEGFDGWPWKTKGHLFYVASSFVHHFVAISEFKLKLQSGNAHFGSKSAIYCPMWPWNLTDDLEQGKSEGFNSCDRPSNLAQIWSKSSIFQPCDLDIWCMTSKNNRAPLLYYIKLCASFQNHQGIETEVTVQKRSIWVKISNFLSRVTLKFDRCPWKTIGHLFYVASSFVHHFTAISEFKLE